MMNSVPHLPRVSGLRSTAGQVSWLSDRPTPRVFPALQPVNLRVSSPITVTGLRRFRTAFPGPSWASRSLHREAIPSHPAVQVSAVGAMKKTPALATGALTDPANLIFVAQDPAAEVVRSGRRRRSSRGRGDIRRLFTYSGSFPTATCGRNVAGPGWITCSTNVSGSTSAFPSVTTPSTTCWSSMTTQTSHRLSRSRFRTAPIGSSMRHVGTSRSAMSATRGVCASRPSRGKPAANQSSLPGWYR